MKSIHYFLRAFALLSLAIAALHAQTTVTVSTPLELANAITAANASGSATTITLAAGTYNLTTALPSLTVNNLTLQGPTTGSPAVINATALACGVIFDVTAANVTIANLGLQNARSHAVAIHAGADNGRIDYCTFSNPTSPAPATAAIDGFNCQNWTVTGNTISGVTGSSATAEPAIHFYGGASGTVVTNNFILNCDRAIGFGGDPAAPSIAYSPVNYSFTVNTAITTLVPTNSGGSVATWSITPALPAGLTFSTTTGQISGTPTAVSAATTYTVTATNTGGSAVATFSMAVGDPNAGQITPVLTTNRVSGVAPLSVFFDATGTTALATTRPFHELEYRWDFGDSSAGTWSRGSNPGVNSKNVSTGANTAHVFETPGTYTVTLVITDGTHFSSATSTITVTDPNVVFAANTTCISTGTDFTGAPTGSTHVTATDFPTALQTALAGGAKRILFKRGDTFTVNTRIQQAASGPVLIGAFGTGSRPYLEMKTSDVYAFESWTANDWRIMDLEIDGSSTTARAVSITGTDCTALRISAHDLGYGFAMGGTRLAIVDSDVQRIPSGSGIMSLWAQDVFGFFVAGSLIDNNGGGEYNMRYQGGTFGVISNNTFVRCGDGKATFTLRGDATQTTYTTQYHQISDNLFDASTSVSVNFIVTVNPQNSGRNEKIKDVIIERNKIISCPGGMYMISITASDVTIRNNLLDASNTGTAPAIELAYGNTAGLPAVNNVNIFHNTIFSSAANGLTGVIIYSDTVLPIQNTVVKNNFMYAPNCIHDGANNGYAATFMYDWGINTVASNNSTDAQIKSASPNLVVFPPVSLSNWALATGCYAIGTGTSVPVWSDFNQKPITATTARNLGAVQ